VSKYIIIGGGLSGLSALVKLSLQGKDVTLLERNSYLGGMVTTRVSDEYVIEKGPNAFMSTYKSFEELLTLLEMNDQVIYNIPGKSARYIYKKNKIHRLPEGPSAFLKTQLLSAKAKIRILAEPFCLRGPSEESVYSFGKRRFGDEVAKTFLDPMISGICAGDYEQIDIKSMFPKLREIESEYRSLLLYLLSFKKNTQKKSGDKKRVFLSLKNGMGSVVDEIEKKVGNQIIKNCDVVDVQKENGKFKISSLTSGDFFADKIIFATPSFVTGKLLHVIDKELSDELLKISYTDLITVSVGVDRKMIGHPCDGFGFLVPRKSGIRVIGGMFLSGIFEGRSPKGKELIKCYIGGEHDKEVILLSDGELRTIIEEELRALLDLRKIDFLDIERVKNAIPQYNLGHKAIVENIERLLTRAEDFSIAGNFLYGVSVDKAVECGFSAQKKWAYL